MLEHIRTLDQLETEALLVDRFLNIACSEDPNEAVERGNKVQAYIARTSKMLADAKFWQDTAIIENTKQSSADYPHLPPLVRRRMIESMCQRENFLVTWIDRMNRAATHQSEWLRTVISKAKAEMQIR